MLARMLAAIAFCMHFHSVCAASTVVAFLQSSFLIAESFALMVASLVPSQVSPNLSSLPCSLLPVPLLLSSRIPRPVLRQQCPCVTSSSAPSLGSCHRVMLCPLAGKENP